LDWRTDIKAVLFDFAGTLVSGHLDTDASRRDAVSLLRSWGYTVTLRQFEEAIEASLVQVRKRRLEGRETLYQTVISSTLASLGIEATSSLVYRLEETDYTHYHWRLRRGVRSSLVTLHEDKLLGVVSNSWADSVTRVLHVSGLREYLDVVVLSKDVGYRKPDRRIFLRAMEKLGLEPRQIAYVGDNYSDDVLGPMAMGMIPIWKGTAVGVDALDIPAVLTRMLPK